MCILLFIIIFVIITEWSWSDLCPGSTQPVIGKSWFDSSLIKAWSSATLIICIYFSTPLTACKVNLATIYPIFSRMRRLLIPKTGSRGIFKLRWALITSNSSPRGCIPLLLLLNADVTAADFTRRWPLVGTRGGRSRSLSLRGRSEAWSSVVVLTLLLRDLRDTLSFSFGGWKTLSLSDSSGM